ncbi:MAG: hypothetical protein PHH68_02540 [Candidatus Omnitrophica bacterium]|jgi:hypothetical protein|nr:hypothetical protein [Candidatus Omnitrophota bacterium]MDD5079187.1 hypothetical protein [Candidatus Omnitrophota bacterium]
MSTYNAGPVFFVILVAVLVAMSFFVMVILQKVTLKKLRNLGIAAVILLWLAALICVAEIFRPAICKKSICPISPGNMPQPMMGMGRPGMMMDNSAYPPEMMEMMKDKGKIAPKND